MSSGEFLARHLSYNTPIDGANCDINRDWRPLDRGNCDRGATPSRACRAACGSRTTRRRAAGCCWRRSASSRPTPSRSKFSSAAPARRRSTTIVDDLAADLQSAARAHPCRRDQAARRSRREETAGALTWRPAASLTKPLGLLAELTHRCPLGCPYCSNPLALEKRDDELDTATWSRVFGEAAGARRAAGASVRRRARRAARPRRDRRVGARGRALHQPDHVGRRHHHADHARPLGGRARPRPGLDPGFAMRCRPTTSPATRARSSASMRSPPKRCGSACC